MSASERRRSRRRAWATAVALFAASALAAGYLGPRLGVFLHREDPLVPGDAVVVLAGARADRWLEAIDLYRAHYAPRIVVSGGEREGAEKVLERQGIRLPTDVEVIRRVLGAFGLPGDVVSPLPGEPQSTAEEAVLVRAFAEEAGWRRVIVVTSKAHTRRARLAFRRAFAGSGIAVAVRASRYDEFDAVHWWRRARDRRNVLFEWIKLVAYACGLGA
jgi:uncharacterized SAM-binding protein YcdF (DUF218 family)